MLTKKQHELLMYINGHLREHGITPSFDEMKDAPHLKSKSGIHRLITGLEERGFLHRLPHRARALEILRLPDSVAAVREPSAASPAGIARFAPNVIEGRFKAALSGVEVASKTDTVELPLYGRIAAGAPIEALRDPTNTVEVPPSMLGKGENYALEVDGDSMIDAGIFDGDIAIIHSCDTAENGAIVVALVDGNEVTLKRLRRKGHSIALEPANKSFETRIFGPDRVRVQGRLVGLMRQY